MGVYISFDNQFYAGLTTANGVSVTKEDVILGTPKDITGTVVGDNTGCNTQIRIEATETGHWSGKSPTYYNRHELTDLKVLLGPIVKFAGAATVHELVPIFNARYGTIFTTADFVDGPLNLDTDGNGTVTFVATPGSLEWRGTVSFQVVKGDYSLSQELTNNVLDGFKYPDGTMGSGTPTGIIAESYSYPLDFTKQFAAISAVPVGVLTATPLADFVAMFNAIEGRTVWVGDGSASWGLQNAVVEYNGANSAEFPTNPNYGFVLVLKLPATNTQFVGKMYLHYNDPDAEV